MYRSIFLLIPPDHGGYPAKNLRMVPGDGLIFRIFRHQPHMAVPAAEGFHRGFAVDHSHHNVAGGGPLLLVDHHQVAGQNAASRMDSPRTRRAKCSPLSPPVSKVR